MYFQLDFVFLLSFIDRKSHVANVTTLASIRDIVFLVPADWGTGSGNPWILVYPLPHGVSFTTPREHMN